MKKILNVLPEYYLIIMGVFWIIQKYVTTGGIGYVTLFATWLLFIQIIYKNRTAGIFYGFLYSVISIFKIYKGISLLVQEHSSLDEALLLITVFGITLSASIIMLVKYTGTTQKYDRNVLTMSS